MKTFLVVLAFVAVLAGARGQDAAFVAHPGVADSAVSAADLKNILLGTKANWSSGPLRLVVLSEGPVHAKVIQQYTQRSPDQFEKYWKKQVFTGKGTMPASAKNDAEVLAFVSSTPGAFGYVAATSVTDKVKLLEVK
jgi:ABC-type phosphate transport system substrate-binding protein